MRNCSKIVLICLEPRGRYGAGCCLSVSKLRLRSHGCPLISSKPLRPSLQGREKEKEKEREGQSLIK